MTPSWALKSYFSNYVKNKQKNTLFKIVNNISDFSGKNGKVIHLIPRYPQY